MLLRLGPTTSRAGFCPPLVSLTFLSSAVLLLSAVISLLFRPADLARLSQMALGPPQLWPAVLKCCANCFSLCENAARCSPPPSVPPRLSAAACCYVTACGVLAEAPRGSFLRAPPRVTRATSLSIFAKAAHGGTGGGRG